MNRLRVSVLLVEKGFRPAVLVGFQQFVRFAEVEEF
jgi:hypothetical protein